MIGRLVRRGVRANILRFLLTTFAVFVGVAFVSAAFGLADQLRGVISTSDLPSMGATGSSQLQIAPKAQGFGPPAALDTKLVDTVAAVDGVESAQPNYFAFVEFDSGAPTQEGFGGLQGVAKASPYEAKDWKLLSGRAPKGPNEVAVDANGKIAGLTDEGRKVPILLPTGREMFDVVGVVESAEPQPGGIMAFIKANAVFDPDNLGRVAGDPSSANAIIATVKPGSDPAEVKRNIEKVLPKGLDVFSAAELDAQMRAQFTAIADAIEKAMLVFAGITLFVGTFLVVNTFTMVVGQRIREFGLLRAVGSSRKQLFTMVTLEALIVGVIASVTGLTTGVLLSAVLGKLINSDSSMKFILTARTVAMALVIGIGVTLISAITPALRASRVQPLAAINGLEARDDKSKRWPTIFALLAVAAAVVLLVKGFGPKLGFSQRMLLLIPGALTLFIGLAILSRFVARPVMTVLGAPVRRKLAARMGATNAARNPRRTASTASALMIGLALIVSVVTVGTSVKNAVLTQFKTSSSAEFFVQSQGFVSIDPAAISDAIAGVDGVDTAVDYSMAIASLKGATSYRVTQMTSSPLTQLAAVLDLGVNDGSTSNLSINDVLLASDAAEEMGVGVGDKVTLSNASGEKRQLWVAATYSRTAMTGQAVIPREISDDLTLAPQFQGVAITTKPGADLTKVRAGLEAVSENFPANKVETSKEVEDEFGSQFDILLRIVSALLIASVLIAGLGVMNTLFLSVIERTREIGLLRAVGGSRRQVRSMVRWEALLTSIFGALLGVAVGTGLGIGIVSALPKSFVGNATVPTAWIITCLIFAIVLGLLAAIFPAFRASRMNVLDAISTDR